MKQKLHICSYVVFSIEEKEKFESEYKDAAIIYLNNDFNFKEIPIIPTIIVGWKETKRVFQKQSISKNKIKENLYWVYSEEEIESNKELSKISNSQIHKLTQQFMKEFLPKNKISYDFISDGNLEEFLLENLNKKFSTFSFFYKKALYIFNENKTISINLETLRWDFQNKLKIKTRLTNLFNTFKIIPYSYNNIFSYVEKNRLENLITFENLFYLDTKEELFEKQLQNLLLQNNNYKFFIPFVESKYWRNITQDEQTHLERMFRKDMITHWLSDKELFFDYNLKNDKLKLEYSKEYKKQFLKVNYSNKRTLTGRINCSESLFNPQMLPKDSEDRKSIVSRFEGGKIAVFDFISFETIISLLLSGDKDFIDKYKDLDFHEETAKVIFGEQNKLNKEKRNIGKNVNHTLLYGGGDKKILEILDYVKNKESVLQKIKDFLSPIITKSKEIQESYKELGYLITSFGTMIYPQKDWAAYNNLVQATAADILVEKLFEIASYLKNKKSKFIFQVHDSFIFDIHPDDLKEINELKELISNFKNIFFQVNMKIGNNLMECTENVKEIVEV